MAARILGVKDLSRLVRYRIRETTSPSKQKKPTKRNSQLSFSCMGFKNTNKKVALKGALIYDTTKRAASMVLFRNGQKKAPT